MESAVSPEVAIEYVVRQGRFAYMASVCDGFWVNRSASKKALHQYSHDLLYYSARYTDAVNGKMRFYNYLILPQITTNCRYVFYIPMPCFRSHRW